MTNGTTTPRSTPVCLHDARDTNGAQQKAVIVFSGGQDSTTCLFWAMQRFQVVECMTFDYGQRHKSELGYAKRIAEKLCVPHHILDMSLLHQLAPNALTREHIAITQVDGQMPNTFVEGRNLLFFSFAAIYAKQIGAQHLVTGVCETDFSGYPDCRDIFIKSLNVTLNLAMNYDFIMHTPLMWLNKAQIWRLADELGVFDFVRTETVTCYYGLPGDGCGECPSCKLRAAGLKIYLTECEQVKTSYVMSSSARIEIKGKKQAICRDTHRLDRENRHT